MPCTLHMMCKQEALYDEPRQMFLFQFVVENQLSIVAANGTTHTRPDENTFLTLFCVAKVSATISAVKHLLQRCSEIYVYIKTNEVLVSLLLAPKVATCKH